MVIRADPGLIGEPDARALDGSLRGNGRVPLFLPPPYRLAVLLVSPVDRALRRHAYLRQQPPRRHDRQAHAELAADQLADHLPRLQRELKLQLPRVAAHDPVPQLPHLQRLQPRRPSRYRPGQQRPRPPSRYFASHPYTVVRCSPSATATSSE